MAATQSNSVSIKDTKTAVRLAKAKIHTTRFFLMPCMTVQKHEKVTP